MSHHIRFTRHTVTGETRCTCTCGWSYCGDRETAQIVGQDHHDRQPINTPAGAKILQQGFVSGLASKRD